MTISLKYKGTMLYIISYFDLFLIRIKPVLLSCYFQILFCHQIWNLILLRRSMDVTMETTFSSQSNKTVRIAANLRCDDNTHVEMSIYYEDEHVSHSQSFTSDAGFVDIPSTTVEIHSVEKCF